MKKKSKRDEGVPHLSGRELLIVELLLEHPGKELYGLELVRESGKRLKRGTVYVTLGRLEDKGFVESRGETEQSLSGTPRRLYRVTGYGQRVYELLQQARELKRLSPACVGAGL